jgi:hypothetical protein
LNLHSNKYGLAGIILPLCFSLYIRAYNTGDDFAVTRFQTPHNFNKQNIMTGCESSTKTDADSSSENQNTSGRTIIENYIRALGGRNNLERINDRTIYLKGEIEGRDLSMIIYQKSPGRMREEISLGPVRQIIVFDGTGGAAKIGGKTLEIKGHELEKLKYESMPRFPLNFDSLGIQIKFLGTEKINGREAYKVGMILPGRAEWTQFYDTVSHLKVREMSGVSVTEGKYVQETDYGDYRPVEGIMYPFSFTQILGSHKSSFRVDSIKINSGLNNDLFDLP